MPHLTQTDIADLVTSSHDRGMIALVYSTLHAYVQAKVNADALPPVRAKMLREALALLEAVRDEVIVEHTEMHARLVNADETEGVDE